MQRSLSALLTATLAIPVVGFTNAYLGAEPQPAPPAWQALAQAPEEILWQEEGWGPQSDLWLQDLDLTPAQRAQIQVLQADAQPNLEALAERLQTEREAMQSLMAGGEAAPEDLRVQYQVLQDLRQALSANRFEVLLAIREVLTPEQQSLLANRLENDHRSGKHDQHLDFQNHPGELRPN
ncbi:MAG: Spy/CpxP family protein refolding chaperone [Cyanobacteria bacterium]|nr:Spy/CpxP family protein refolding chaperone [Cyanobacteriota bacterium]MDA0866615.1 Spy/CpxP family protein refolding chaperone [Cyanobacteriota bacterium]